MSDLTEYEITILREVNGDQPARTWGAAVGAALESLRGSGYISGGQVTPKGQALLRRLNREPN